MKKLIELDSVLDVLDKIDCSDGVGLSTLKCDVVDDAVATIKALPTVDAVPVVRCRDCRHWSGRKYNVHINGFLPWCRFSALQREANDFCSYGERKGGDHEND